MPGAELPHDNAELLAVLAGLARDRSSLEKRELNRAELGVLRLVLRSQLQIAIDPKHEPLLLPSLLPRLRGPGRVALVFTDEEATRGWSDARKRDGPMCGGFAPAGRFVGSGEPDPKRWRRWLQRNSVNELTLNPAGPLTFTATTVDFDSASSRLGGRGATAPDPDPGGAWLDRSDRVEVRERACRLLDQLAQLPSDEDVGAEQREEITAVNRFGSRLFQSQLALLPGRGNLSAKLYGSFGAASAGDPCLAADGLLELRGRVASALDREELDDRQRKQLETRLKTTVSVLRGLVDLGYRTGEIKQLTAAHK